LADYLIFISLIYLIFVIFEFTFISPKLIVMKHLYPKINLSEGFTLSETLTRKHFAFFTIFLLFTLNVFSQVAGGTITFKTTAGTESIAIEVTATDLFDGGNKYTGQFKNGLQNGQGTHTYVNGGRYVGQWKDGKYHGHGVFTKNNGETYQAIDGKRVGHVGAKARLAKANRAENLRIWSFLALISPVWGLIICIV